MATEGMEMVGLIEGQSDSALAFESHVGLSLGAESLLLALIADRFERCVDRMLYAGQSRLGMMGRPEHLAWLYRHVHAMKQMPITAYIALPGAELSGHGDPSLACPFQIKRPEGVADPDWYSVDDPSLGEVIDTLLIADDQYQEACISKAKLVVAPQVSIMRLYDRLPIGAASLEDQKPLAVSPVVVRKASVRAAEGSGALN